ncbi:hypothetical protein [Candidatus Marithrix sp. Canyon 246]|uniref:hypothetical protein n=1 Tax=Candidatus Marithrix sp. Canyon 246 TaxID=1827136 RepID=UPI00084A0591|nr:hypothetical protein [Candidatus Marithrix sp. Canyon 246]
MPSCQFELEQILAFIIRGGYPEILQIDNKTVAAYIEILEAMYIIKIIPSYFVNLSLSKQPIKFKHKKSI